MQTKQFQVGSYVMGTTANFNADGDFDIPLDRLPAFLTPGLVAVVTGFELKVAGRFTTNASDAALFSFLLHGQLDVDLVGPAAFKMEHRHGWHDPILSILQWGTVYGTRCADLPATGGGGPGSYTRTFTKHIDLVEPYMSSRFARCMPAIAFAKSSSFLRVHPFGAARTVKGVHLGMDQLTLTVIANIIELPPNLVPMPVMVETTSVEKNKDTEPTPDTGAYLRIGLVNDPKLATTADDLSGITKVNSFGFAGAYSVQDKTVEQLLRQFNEENARDPHNPYTPASSPTTASPTVKSENRLLDPQENVDGLTRYIPFFQPKRGSDIAGIARWFGAKPVAVLNNDAGGGPASVDILVQRVQPTTDAWKTAIAGALGDEALGRKLIVPSGYVDRATKRILPGVDANRIPLIIDASSK